MSPTLVFDAEGKLFAVLGSAGGGAIINHVAETLVALIDWKLSPAEALALPRFGSRNGPTELEAGTRAEALADALRALGHEVRVGPDPSGLHLVVRKPGGGWFGAADPRRNAGSGHGRLTRGTMGGGGRQPLSCRWPRPPARAAAKRNCIVPAFC